MTGPGHRWGCIALLVALPLGFSPPGPAPAEIGGPLVFSDLSPNGGEVLAGGAAYTIAWNATHGGDSLVTATVEYTFNESGGYPYFLARWQFPLPSGSFEWQVPRYNTTSARVRVCGIARDGDSACIASAGNFTIQAPPPYLDLLSPGDGALGVDVRAPLVLGMDEVDLGTLSVATTPPVTLMGTWDPVVRTMTYDHAEPFAACTLYTVTAQAQATDGTPLGPYSWTFWTPCGVYILWTNPADGEENVSLSASISMEFSGPLSPASAWIQIIPPVPFSSVWAVGDTWLTLVPTLPLDPCTTYRVEVGSPDLIPGPAPNPWAFSTVCHPHITSTDPPDGAISVGFYAPIVVEFSVPINPASLGWTVSPSLDLTPSWSDNDTLLTLSHVSPFWGMTVYTVHVWANDTYGRPLVPFVGVPNPWQFSTTCPPQILVTTPSDGQGGFPLDAPIYIYFCRPMDPPSVTVTILPPVGNVTLTWFDRNMTVRVDHDPFAPCTWYSVMVTGRSADGQPLLPGPVPNPWSFMTDCVEPIVRGLTIDAVEPNTVRLSWEPVPFATLYRVYESRDRLLPFPWPVLGTATEPWFNATGHLDDGLPHYYIVRAVAVFVEGPNSTMAVKIPIGVPFDGGRTNLYWHSLPYRNGLRNASDIADALPAGGIDFVGHWDAANATLPYYFYFRGEWRGQDFPIRAGEGFLLGSFRPFSWVVLGTDTALPLAFASGPSSSVHWSSLPYTGPYARASDVVLDIEGSLNASANSRIAEVGIWDGTAQSLVRFYWTTTGWSGVDFDVPPGAGVYLRVVSDFTWVPRLLTPEVP